MQGVKQNTRSWFPGSGCLVLATSYSRTTFRRTTIGAAAFHFRVRNGNGWDHRASITRLRAGVAVRRVRGGSRTVCLVTQRLSMLPQRTAGSLISTYRFLESFPFKGFVLF